MTFKDHILLWQEFCPQFPWVGPLAYNTTDVPTDGEATTNYLGEYWDSTAQIQKVHFRQFGWTADGDDQGTDSNKNHFWTDRLLKNIGGYRIRFEFESLVKVYYHCVVKVCELDQADECAFYKLNSNGGKSLYFITSFIITS